MGVATAPAAGVGKLVGGNIFARLKGPPVLVSAPNYSLASDGRALRRCEGRTSVSTRPSSVPLGNRRSASNDVLGFR